MQVNDVAVSLPGQPSVISKIGQVVTTKIYHRFITIAVCAVALSLGARESALARILMLAHYDGAGADADVSDGSAGTRPVPGYEKAKTTESGRWGGAVDLNDPATTCTYQAQGNFNPTKGSVDFWFYIDKDEAEMYHPLFGWYHPPSQPGNQKRISALEVYTRNGGLTLGIYTPDHYGPSKAAGIQAGKWYHLEVNWDCRGGDGQSNYQVFLNGKRVIQVSGHTALEGDGGTLHLGVWDYGWGHFLNGRIDELRITDQVEHTGNFPVPEEPYLKPGTLPFVQVTYRQMQNGLNTLITEIDSLEGAVGTVGKDLHGDTDDMEIMRQSRNVAKKTQTSLATIEQALGADQPDLNSIEAQLNEAGDGLNSALLAIARITQKMDAEFAKEDARSRLFKDLNDEIVGDAIFLKGKQLFIDDYLIEEIQGVRKVLNQPTKHPRNPLVVPDLPWEQHGFYANGTVLYDKQEKLFKAWIHLWKHEGGELAATRGLYAYLTSRNGIDWTKPVINTAEKNNRILPPDGALGFSGEGIMKDPLERNPARRYKIIYNSHPAGNPEDWQTGVAYSPDGISWTADPRNPVIPFGDSQAAPLWDARRQAYLAFVRTGPPNIRGIARIESHDFTHWSPKVTVFPPGGTKLDGPFRSVPYGMKAISYAGNFIGLLNMYHWETLGPIPEDKLWQDKVNVQLAFSRNGITWNRVGPNGVIPHIDLSQDRDWKTIAENQTFLQYGKHKQEWDWGQIYSYHAPVVFDDKIWIYYTGLGSRHWSNYHGDERPPKSGMGLATLRLDGFVSLDAEQEGTMTTRPFICVGDTLVINAATNPDREGKIRVEAIDALGRVIKGFARDDCQPMTGDSVRHVVSWNGVTDCNPIQARPIQLRFYLEHAKLYSLEFRVRHQHFVPFAN